MKLALKIEATRSIEGLGLEGVNTSTLSVEVLEEDFKLVLGKALYEVEVQGYTFSTSEVYEDTIKNFETLSLRRQYQKIYASDVLKVSVKIA